ncbi:unnamed protein product [Vitrella brassicaformis CCMP3155]|uniref:Uncharacterized protein n=1 Tax=Vitrella brassicaformis (strain CCMP3155) TaxID=1169540 RepID=A0A0G4EXM3_VITBC|nr:unnamed protein product [Vitrella brassicaformis CCMP3155]|eukprot:CEM03354.1 unnamed protein product [Vitrella brassicaformis CCMP3155]
MAASSSAAGAAAGSGAGDGGGGGGSASRRAPHLTVLAHPSHLMQHNEQQQHPVSYLCVGRRSRYLLSIKDVVRLRATCTWLRELFGAAQLRDRLSHSLGSQAGLRRAVNGQQLQLLRFDDNQFGTHDLLGAVCVVEEGGWDEMGGVIELARQCGNCELPVTLSGADINTHANKAAYLSAPHVLAQLKMAGRHVHFNDGSCLQLFHHADGEVRAIKDEPDFRLEVDTPLHAGHLYQQHRPPQDPPVRERIGFSTDYIGFLTDYGRWVRLAGPGITQASVSSFAKAKILSHFINTRQTTNEKFTILNRGVGGGRLDDLLTQSPHTPMAGCTTTVSWDGRVRWLVLTDGSRPFVAWIVISTFGNDKVRVCILTTEAAACEGGAFKHRFPLSTQLARVALGAVASFVFDS